jgi:hypothetical protein
MVSPELRRRTPPAAPPIVAVSSQAYVVEFDQTASTMRATRTWPFISANFTIELQVSCFRDLDGSCGGNARSRPIYRAQGDSKAEVTYLKLNSIVIA